MSSKRRKVTVEDDSRKPSVFDRLGGGARGAGHATLVSDRPDETPPSRTNYYEGDSTVCRHWQKTGNCPFGPSCTYTHGISTSSKSKSSRYSDEDNLRLKFKTRKGNDRKRSRSNSPMRASSSSQHSKKDKDSKVKSAVLMTEAGTMDYDEELEMVRHKQTMQKRLNQLQLSEDECDLTKIVIQKQITSEDSGSDKEVKKRVKKSKKKKRMSLDDSTDSRKSTKESKKTKGPKTPPVGGSAGPRTPSPSEPTADTTTHTRKHKKKHHGDEDKEHPLKEKKKKKRKSPSASPSPGRHKSKAIKPKEKRAWSPDQEKSQQRPRSRSPEGRADPRSRSRREEKETSDYEKREEDRRPSTPDYREEKRYGVHSPEDKVRRGEDYKYERHRRPPSPGRPLAYRSRTPDNEPLTPPRRPPSPLSPNRGEFRNKSPEYKDYRNISPSPRLKSPPVKEYRRSPPRETYRSKSPRMDDRKPGSPRRDEHHYGRASDKYSKYPPSAAAYKEDYKRHDDKRRYESNRESYESRDKYDRRDKYADSKRRSPPKYDSDRDYKSREYSSSRSSYRSRGQSSAHPDKYRERDERESRSSRRSDWEDRKREEFRDKLYGEKPRDDTRREEERRPRDFSPGISQYGSSGRSKDYKDRPYHDDSRKKRSHSKESVDERKKLKVEDDGPGTPVHDEAPDSRHPSPTRSKDQFPVYTREPLPDGDKANNSSSNADDVKEAKRSDIPDPDHKEDATELGYESISDDDIDDILGQEGEDDEEKRPEKVDILDIDWRSLISESVPKPDIVPSALKRFTPAAIFSKLGVSQTYAGQGLVEKIQKICQQDTEVAVEGDGSSKTNGFVFSNEVAAFHSSELVHQHHRAKLVSDLGPFRKALCARRDLAIRRGLCKTNKYNESSSVYPTGIVDTDLYKLSLQLFKNGKEIAKTARA